MKYIGIVLFVSLCALPLVAQAAPFDNPIIPEVCKCDSVPGPDGKLVSSAPAFGCVFQTVQNIIRIVIMLAFVVATLAFLYAGFTWITSAGNPGRVEQGKNLLLNVVVGLAVLLGAWLIVDFVMKTLYRGDSVEFGPWNNILVGTERSREQCLTVKNPRGILSGSVDVVERGGSGGDPGGETIRSIQLTHEAALERLRAAGVRVTAGTLAGTMGNTIDQAVEIKKACNCDVVVTSTTGGSHETEGTLTHGAGYKIDIDNTSAVDRFFRRVLTRSGARPGDHGGPRYLDSCGNEYVYETNYSHWDITVNRGVCSL